MKHARKDYNQRIQDSAGLIPDDEPVLLIRGQDACALAAGQAWVDRARELHASRSLAGAIEVSQHPSCRPRQHTKGGRRG